MHVSHKEKLHGLTLKIVLDDMGGTDSPIENDEAVIFAVLHRRYVNPAKDTTIYKVNGESYDFTTPEGIAEFEKDNEGDDAAWAVFPLFMYDHSGTSYRASMGGNPFHCPWDSGRVGIIALEKKQVGKPGTVYKTSEGERTIGSYLDQANDLCEAYTQWANGEIYGYIIEDETGDELDSCWGFIGHYDGYVLEQARDSLKSLAKDHEPVANIKITYTQARFVLNEFSADGAYSPDDLARMNAVKEAITEAFHGIEEDETEDAE